MLPQPKFRTVNMPRGRSGAAVLDSWMRKSTVATTPAASGIQTCGLPHPRSPFDQRINRSAKSDDGQERPCYVDAAGRAWGGVGLP